MAEAGSVVPNAPPVARYTIDGGLAGRSRLDVLAEVMGPTSAALLAAVIAPGGKVIVEDVDFTGAFCFPCDKALLRVFLAASDWPVGKDFP